VLVPVWSLAFSRPAIVAAAAARSSLAAPRWTDWRRAVLVSLAMLLAIAGAYQLTATTSAGAAAWCEPLAAMMFAAVALDAFDDLRVRRGDLVVIWPLHQAQHAELVCAVLADAGIECHLAASHLRALLAWFGPYAPIDVLVPAASADAARGKIGALFETAAVEAFD
jgi:preprotein translocase subunit SecY